MTDKQVKKKNEMELTIRKTIETKVKVEFPELYKKSGVDDCTLNINLFDLKCSSIDCDKCYFSYRTFKFMKDGHV